MPSDMLSFVRNKHPWLSEFDVQVFSCLLGAAKPSPESFLHTAKLLGVRPEDILLVDDRQANIDGAAQVGMKTMFYESPECYRELEQLLLDLGVPLRQADGRQLRGAKGEF